MNEKALNITITVYNTGLIKYCFTKVQWNELLKVCVMIHLYNSKKVSSHCIKIDQYTLAAASAAVRLASIVLSPNVCPCRNFWPETKTDLLNIS